MNVPLIAAEEGFSSLARHMSRWMEQVLGSDYARFHSEQAWSPAIGCDPGQKLRPDR